AIEGGLTPEARSHPASKINPPEGGCCEPALAGFSVLARRCRFAKGVWRICRINLLMSLQGCPIRENGMSAFSFRQMAAASGGAVRLGQTRRSAPTRDRFT